MPRHWSDVLDFWFDAASGAERGRPRKPWFQKSETFDAEIRTRYATTVEAGAAGALAAWERTPLAALALVIVLDQFPRNMFRGSPRAFATDPLALAVANRLVARGYDAAYLCVERAFAYLPFEHAEDLAMQHRSVELFASLPPDPVRASYLDYARRHYDIIARFGRFPHRNDVLGRASTPDEVAFLAQPGSGF